MKKFLCAAILSAILVTPAFAADEKPVPEIDPQLCNSLVEHKKAADVDFKPGVDVHGKPVVEADINPSPIKAPERITFDITIDTAKYLGLSTPGLEGLTNVGSIEYEKGKLTFNGEPMEGHAAKALRELCTKKPETAPVAETEKTPEKPVETAPEAASDIHIQ